MQERHALLVIDMQLCGFDGKITPPIDQGDRVLRNVSSLIDSVRSSDLPIVYVQTCAPSGRPYAKDSHGWAIHPRVAPTPADRIVYKKNSDAFEDTNLETLLLDGGINSVIVCGIWSEFCVTNTCLSALKLGFKVYVGADAHGTVSNDERDAGDTVARQNDYLRDNRAHVADIEELRETLGLV